jgi:hypothetical protein
MLYYATPIRVWYYDQSIMFLNKMNKHLSCNLVDYSGTLSTTTRKDNDMADSELVIGLQMDELQRTQMY